MNNGLFSISRRFHGEILWSEEINAKNIIAVNDYLSRSHSLLLSLGSQR